MDSPTGWCIKVCTVRCSGKFVLKMFLLDSALFNLVQLFYQFSSFYALLGFRLESNLCFEGKYISTTKYCPNK